MSIIKDFPESWHTDMLSSELRFMVAKELSKAEGKKYTKTFKKKVARNLTQLLHSCITARDFKVVVTPTDGTRFNLDIEPKDK
jgi:hypothetical protein